MHVPYCRTRCGYCDFNTYTAAELGPGVSQASFAGDLVTEIDLVGEQWHPEAPVDTVFFGGGTPTMLPASDLVGVLDRIDEVFGLASDVEVTTEANPESVDYDYLAELRSGGFTRLSLGMQSASTAVLAALDRAHTPGRVQRVVAEARAAGFQRVSVDLIYGTPGESDDDWRDSLNAAVEAGVDHVSAYALTVEDGTAMAAAVRRGKLPVPDPDIAAARYEVADEILTGAGFEWYEISNWARPGQQCRHNLGYWDVDAQWWGFGPGAHGHVGDLRLVNVKHPKLYAEELAADRLPLAEYEVVSAEERRLERIMLSVRLRRGVSPWSDSARQVLEQLVAEGLMTRVGERFVLSRTGRLLADTATLRLAEADA